MIGAEMYSADTIVATSDCPLVDPFLINNMLSIFEKKQLITFAILLHQMNQRFLMDQILRFFLKMP